MDSNNIMFSILCLALFGLYYVNTQTVTDAKNLRTYIFTTNTYDAKVRPSDKQWLAIDVYVAFYLLNLNSLDEVTETMKTTGFLYVTWQDEQLDWTPSAFGGIYDSYWPQGDLWKPDIALKNSAIQYKPLGDTSLNVYVTSNGSVLWQPFQVFESTCSVTITYFPFDIQTCKMEFVAWSYTKEEVMMLGDSARGIDLTLYQENPTWKILNTSWTADFDKLESSITFTIKLQRKPLYILLSIVFPILLLTILNVFTFALPCEGGEKSGYAVTIFLAFAVFLTIVETTLPENSENVAIFSVYVIMMTTMSTIITIIALIEARVSAWDENIVPIPGCVKTLANLARCMPCRNLCSKRKHNREVENKPKSYAEEKSATQSNDDCVEESDSGHEHEEYTWRSVISGLDLFCFIVFTSFAVLGNFLFLVFASSPPQ